VNSGAILTVITAIFLFYATLRTYVQFCSMVVRMMRFVAKNTGALVEREMAKLEVLCIIMTTDLIIIRTL
jgi:hypothetical protein